MSAGLASAGGSGDLARGRVDVVAWARALGVSSGDEVWEHAIKTSADIARVLDELTALIARVRDYPDDELRADVVRAFGLLEDVGHEVLRVARSTDGD